MHWLAGVGTDECIELVGVGTDECIGWQVWVQMSALVGRCGYR